MTLKEFRELTKDMPENTEVLSNSNALLYRVDRVEQRILWNGKEKQPTVIIYGIHRPLC